MRCSIRPLHRRKAPHRAASALEPPDTELTYQPMLEVVNCLRDSAYRTYIVTGRGQDFVRVYAKKI